MYLKKYFIYFRQPSKISYSVLINPGIEALETEESLFLPWAPFS
jgi:hypothetical protein